jgi:hypothetical protein
MEQIVFECTRLKGTGKAGGLTPDKDGCYTLILGGLDVYNAHGDLYVYDAAKQFFESNHPFMRRVNRGVLRGEYDHPVKLPGMSFREFGHRLTQIDPNQVCCTHRKIWLDFKNVVDTNTGRPVITIMGKVFPMGPKGQFLKEQLDAVGEQVCFSIRSFVNETPLPNGRAIRAIRSITTFDYVNEPGVEYAEKLRSPALEAHTDVSVNLTRADLEAIVADQTRLGISNESTGLTRATINEIFRTVEVNPKAYLNW